MALPADRLPQPGETGRDAIVYKFPTRPEILERDRVGRARLVVAGFMALLGLLAGAWGGPAGAAVSEPGSSARPATAAATSVAHAGHGPSVAGASSLVVQPGDTLWSIAAEHAPAGADLRSYVDRLAALNRAEGTLIAGSSLQLPPGS